MLISEYIWNDLWGECGGMSVCSKAPWKKWGDVIDVCRPIESRSGKKAVGLSVTSERHRRYPRSGAIPVDSLYPLML